jgi:4a-hydroxytetrahydrobiopterin dehydratase
VSDLADRSCVPCRGGVPPLEAARVAALAREVPGWEVVGGHHLTRRFATRDFRRALELANRFGEIAEDEGHHPVLHVGWGWVAADVWTHAIDGLTESDFVLAAKLSRAAAAGGVQGGS